MIKSNWTFFLAVLALSAFFSVGTSLAASTYYDSSEVLKTPIGPGNVYYVDGTNGSDSNDGRSEASAFKTISRAVSSSGSLTAGDTVLIKAGIYREAVAVTKKGTANARITIGPYGNGEVIVDASPKLGTWSSYGGGTYVTPWPSSYAPAAVVIDDVPLYPSLTGVAGVVANRWYYDATNRNLYVRVAAGDSPAGHSVVAVEDHITDGHCIFLNHADYVTIYGLTLRGASSKGVSILGDYNRVEQCRVRFTGNSGIGLFAYSTSITIANQVHKNEVYHTMLKNWPRGRDGFKYGGWGKGIDSIGVPGTIISGNVVHKNGGEGVGIGKSTGGIIENNVVYDNWSVNIYSNRNDGTVIRNNTCYVTSVDPNDLLNNGDTNPSDGSNLKRLRPEGIMTADENSPAAAQNFKIYNNLIVNCRRGITHYAVSGIGSGLKNSKIYNNTIVVPDVDATGDVIVGIRYDYNQGNNYNSEVKNNIVIASNPTTNVARWGTSGDPADPGITWDNNLYYHLNKSNPFSYRGTLYSFAGWKSAAGQDQDGIYANPQVVNLQFGIGGDFHLASGSPAAGKGDTSVAAIVDADHDGTVRPSPPSIGGFEAAGGSSAPTVPSVTIAQPANGATVSGDVVVNASGTDTAAISKLELYLNGSLVATSATGTLSFTWNTTAYANGSYALSAKAYNSSGTAGQSNTVNVTVSNDKQAPTVAITSPASGSSVTGAVSVTATASDDVAVKRVELYVNGALYASSSSAPYSWSWDSLSVSAASYTLVAKAYDAAGNVGVSAPVTVVRSDTVPPTVAITYPTTATTSVKGVVTVTVSAADNVAVSKAELYVNGKLLGSSTAAPYSFTWNTALFPVGYNTLVAKAYDAAGNVTSTAPLSVKVLDTAPPTVTIISPVAGSKVGSSVAIAATAKDNVAVKRMIVYVDGVQLYSVYSSSVNWTWSSSSYAAGAHSIVVKVYDSSNNVANAKITVYK